MELDVLLLAAGIGTRLRPLTEQIPKALLPVGGVPLLERHLSRLLGGPRGTAAPGPVTIRKIVVNSHHRADQLRTYLDAHPHRDRIHLSHEPQILGTGGGIARAAEHLRSDPIAVINCDALYDAPLTVALDFHLRQNARATMILIRAPRWASVLTRGDRVSDILRAKRHPEGWTFTGCHLLSQALVGELPRGCFHDIIETYTALIPAGALAAFVDPGGADSFLDVGTPADYLIAHQRVLGPDFARQGAADPRAEIGADARIGSSVILGGARVALAARLTRCIVGPGAQVSGELRDRLVTSLGDRTIEWPAEAAPLREDGEAPAGECST